MATRNISTKIQLDGEKEYKRALSEINSGMRVLKSEMEKTSAQFSDNANSMEALTKKGDILERQILSQKDKIGVLKDALKECAVQYGESDKRTQKYQIDLNKAEAEFFRMNHELDANKDAIAKAGEATEKASSKFSLFSGEAMGLGDALEKVSGKLGVNLPQGLTESLNGIMKINPAVVAMTGLFAAAVTAISKIEQKLKDLTMESASFADDMLTTSQITGLSTETLQEWSYAAELMDVDINTVQSSMARLVRSMSDARNGTGKAKDTFSELGVQLTDTNGNLRDSEDVFWDVIEALGGIGSVSERDAAAMEIFGRSAQDLNPLIINGRAAFEEYAKEAHEAGAVLSGEGLNALGAVDDAQQRLLQTQKAVSNQIAQEYAPYMEKSLTMTKDLIQDIGKALVESGAVDAFGSILISIQSMLQPLAELGREILPPVAAILKVIAGAVAIIADTANAAIGLITFDYNRYSTALGANPNQASNMQRFMYGSDYKRQWDTSQEYYGQEYNPETGLWQGNYHNAAGTLNWRGGVTWVGEAGPERVYLPAGSRVMSAQESRSMGGNTYVNLYVDHINDLQQLIEIVNSARIKERMGGGN